MSKPNRGRSSDRLSRRMEFSFSSFSAVQVPLVSDRLLITIILVGTGKTIAKSSKAAALNGICQWPDSILQPIRFSRDEVSQEFHECQCKIVVSMGSTKTAILGEAVLNLTNYLSSSDSTDISLPLKRCNSGTVLQLKIQCLGAKKSSGKSWGELSARLADSSPTNGEMDRKADDFYNIVNKSARSLSENQDESENRIDPIKLAVADVPDFRQPSRNETHLEVRAVARSAPVADRAARELEHDRGAGEVGVEVRASARVCFAVGGVRSKHYNMRAVCSPVVIGLSPASARSFRSVPCDVAIS